MIVLHLANCTGQLWKLKVLLVNHAVKERPSQKPKVNRASSPYGGLFNYTNKKMLKEKTERSLCVHQI